MKSILKEPGKEPKVIDVENEKEELQETVGGYLESVTLAADMCILCDEEGRLKGLPFNVEICGVSFVGPILMVGVDGEEFADLWEPDKVMDVFFN